MLLLSLPLLLAKLLLFVSSSFSFYLLVLLVFFLVCLLFRQHIWEYDRTVCVFRIYTGVTKWHYLCFVCLFVCAFVYVFLFVVGVCLYPRNWKMTHQNLLYTLQSSRCFVGQAILQKVLYFFFNISSTATGWPNPECRDGYGVDRMSGSQHLSQIKNDFLRSRKISYWIHWNKINR